MPLKNQNSNAFNGFFAVVGCFRALLSRTTSGVLSAAPRTRRHAGGGSYKYHRHTPRTAPPRPIWPQTCIGVSAAAAAARMSASGRVWWWAVSRSRTPTTRCRAGACAKSITPVCVGGRWTSVDVAVWATGCCRGATTDGSAHTRGRQDQPNDKDQWAWVSADTVSTTGCDPWVLAIAKRPSSRQSTEPGWKPFGRPFVCNT